ncbi:MAG TPA: VapC toxin family PIN domain ribonuclease [Chloroflexi bacterium]|nr:VapC toxin family PIN domain ribonuclease [Chloroflexota bacterium]HCG02676.1 VapC toxin family PIN domain ribonuclease [Chloroflexota bacterium]
MTYLLDTNACIALINGRPETVRRRFERASSAGERLATSSIVLFELWYGVAKSQRSKANAERVATFLAGPLEVFDFTTEDADHAGRVRAALESVGKPIGAYDLLIAGQALRHKATLVTANSSEFSRIRGLRLQDWAATRR